MARGVVGGSGSTGVGSAAFSGETRGDDGERLRRLMRVTDVALAHLAPEDLLDELLVRVREILETDTAVVLLLDEAAGELVARAANGLEEEVEQGVRIPLGTGFAGTIAEERRPIVLPRVDRHNVVNPILNEKGIRSLLGVPLLVNGRVLGVLHVGTRFERHFTKDDVELLQLVAERVALALHVRLYERQRVVTETLQRMFLPEATPVIPGLRIATRYRPASSAAIGGDWYDVFVLPSGALALAMGDVAGHGPEAASVMGRLRNALRAYSAIEESPAEIVARLDRLMKLLEADAIVTLLFGIVDANLTGFRFVSAGHVPPLVADRAGHRFAAGRPTDPPLGTGRLRTFGERYVALEPGASLLLFTDGLVERRDESIQDGLERLRTAAASIAEAGDPSERITAILHETLGDVEPFDDIAMLLVRREEPSSALAVRVSAEASELVQVRRALRRWLLDLDVPDEVCDELITAAGEACSNAIEHAYGPVGGRVKLTATREDGLVEIAVQDHGRWRGRPTASGRGIPLMRALADEVEIERSSAGTTVWLRREVGVG